MEGERTELAGRRDAGAPRGARAGRSSWDLLTSFRGGHTDQDGAERGETPFELARLAQGTGSVAHERLEGRGPSGKEAGEVDGDLLRLAGEVHSHENRLARRDLGHHELIPIRQQRDAASSR